MSGISSDIAFAAALIALRVFAVLWFLPFPGSPRMPLPVMAALSAGIAICLWRPGLSTPTAFMSGTSLGFAVLFELGVGLFIGFGIQVILMSYEALGRLTGLFVGEYYSRHTGTLWLAAGLAVFFLMRGHHQVLGALQDSFLRFPPGSSFDSRELAHFPALFGRLVSSSLLQALVIATPFAVCAVVTTWFLKGVDDAMELSSAGEVGTVWRVLVVYGLMALTLAGTIMLFAEILPAALQEIRSSFTTP